MINRPILKPQLLESICLSIADTSLGLTGTEIAKLLADSNIADVSPGITKWKRLYNAFIEWQNRHQCSNHILKFIQNAMQPVRYIGNEEIFQNRRNEINKRLSFIGVELAETGMFRTVENARTIAEAEQRADRYKYKLESRNVHKFIYDYCNAELLVDNYFHSVFEATKSIADRLRNLTSLTTDGNALVDTVFSTSNPLLQINDLKDDTDRSEHIGLSNFIKGVFSLIRNPTAHQPKIKFVITEEEALDVMTSISYIHKRLDKATK